jgi:hypothetical protein
MFRRLINNKPIQNVYKRNFSDKFLSESESERELKLINQNLDNISKKIENSFGYLILSINVLTLTICLKK